MDKWRDHPNTIHAWAFVFYCRRQGDDVHVQTSCDCYPAKKFCGHPMTITIRKART